MSNVVPMPGTIGGARLIFNDYTLRIGIVGLGFVGTAIQNSFDLGAVSLLAIDPAKHTTTTYQDLTATDAVFICVPTPLGEEGRCDTSILEQVLTNLKSVNYKGVIISKCTAPPKVYERLQEEYPNLVHSPEFVTSANANQDYYSAKFAYIGGSISAYRNEAERIIRISQPNLETVIHCTITEAALAKYVINSFLATKVVFMNEIFQLSNALNCNYDKIARMVATDSRIGSSHFKVPGKDGTYGFGGHCFPKDINSLLSFAQDVGVPLNVLEAANKKNTLLRLKE